MDQPDNNKPPVKKPEDQSVAERYFESMLWNSRLIVILAVIASLIMAIGVFYLTAVEVYFTISHLGNYHSLPEAERAILRAQTIAHVIGSVDGFLLGTVMLIFSLGLYELFISPIDAADGKSTASKILMINSLDDLKDKLSKVILIILIVMFFEQAIFLKPTAPLELLYYALAIALVALALFFSYKSYDKK